MNRYGLWIALIALTSAASGEAAGYVMGHSPNGRYVVGIDSTGGDPDIYVAKADGKNRRYITRNDALDNFPSWSHDGQRILFASNRSGKWQVYEHDLVTDHVAQLTDEPADAMYPSYGPGDGVTYHVMGERVHKMRKSTLVVLDSGKRRVLVSDDVVFESKWSGDGKTLALSFVDRLEFRDRDNKVVTVVKYERIDKRLSAHSADGIAWHKDGKRLSCRIRFLGGRTATLDGKTSYIYGDDEVFEVGVDGKVKVSRAQN